MHTVKFICNKFYIIYYKIDDYEGIVKVYNPNAKSSADYFITNIFCPPHPYSENNLFDNHINFGVSVDIDLDNDNIIVGANAYGYYYHNINIRKL